MMRLPSAVYDLLQNPWPFLKRRWSAAVSHSEGTCVRRRPCLTTLIPLAVARQHAQTPQSSGRNAPPAFIHNPKLIYTTTHTVVRCMSIGIDTMNTHLPTAMTRNKIKSI